VRAVKDYDLGRHRLFGSHRVRIFGHDHDALCPLHEDLSHDGIDR